MSDKKEQQREFINLISEKESEDSLRVTIKDNKDLFLPYYKKEINFINNAEYIRFVKSVEALIRHSKEYKAYISYLKNDVGLNHCMIYKHINDDIAPIEMHHGPIFTLFDYVEITIVYFFKKENGLVSSFRIADQVLQDHFDNIIQVVMLSEMVHNAVHPKGKNVKPEFIDIDIAWGDIVSYIQKYSNCFTYGHIFKIKRYIDEWEERNKHNSERISIFKTILEKWKT